MNPLRGTAPLNSSVEVSAGTDVLPSKESPTTGGAVGAPLGCCCAMAGNGQSKAASAMTWVSERIGFLPALMGGALDPTLDPNSTEHPITRPARLVLAARTAKSSHGSARDATRTVGDHSAPRPAAIAAKHRQQRAARRGYERRSIDLQRPSHYPGIRWIGHRLLDGPKAPCLPLLASD